MNTKIRYDLDSLELANGDFGYPITEKEVQKAAGLKVDEELSETEKQYRQFLKETGRTRRAYREI